MNNEWVTSMSMTCRHCKTKQVVQANHTTFRLGQGAQNFPCVECKTDIEVSVPDRIIGGPYRCID
jgi:hypothetical protein